MASASTVLSEDQFLCSICLDVFSQPVTIPCGHNFCMACIGDYWSDTTILCQCPMCKETFTRRPELKVNTFISEMVDQFRTSAKATYTQQQQPASPGEVTCDVCPERTTKALKSCLECLTSYCELHLEPHQRVAGLKRHTLIDPVENLEDRMCAKHQKLLDLFCGDDQTCVCGFCTETEHRDHRVVPLEDGYEERKAWLREATTRAQTMIAERQKKVREIKHSVQLTKTEAAKEIAEGGRVFAALVRCIETSHAELIEAINGRQKAAEGRAGGMITELEREIAELKRRKVQLEELSNIQDHFLLLQNPPNLLFTKHTKAWSKVDVQRDLCVTPLMGAKPQLEEILLTLESSCDAELRKLRRHMVDVTLDPDTASPELILTEDRKQVRVGHVKHVPDNPERFDNYLCVLGKEGLSSGRFYYEVRVAGKTWWWLGVARESVKRKGHEYTLNTEHGYWCVVLITGGDYLAMAGTPAPLNLKHKPQTVGVFVDYEEGRVSFYDVEARSHIYSFTGCAFAEKLYPFFSPCYSDDGKNTAPLVVTPVNHADCV